jgi:hypothetical protein
VTLPITNLDLFKIHVYLHKAEFLKSAIDSFAPVAKIEEKKSACKTSYQNVNSISHNTL